MDSTCGRGTTPGRFPHEVPTPNIQDPLAGPHQELRGRSAHRSRPGVGSHKTVTLPGHASTPSTPVSCWSDSRPSSRAQLERHPGRPNNRWIDQLRRDNNDTPPADVWRRSTMHGHTGVTLRSSTTTRWRRRRRLYASLAVLSSHFLYCYDAESLSLWEFLHTHWFWASYNIDVLI